MHIYPEDPSVLRASLHLSDSGQDWLSKICIGINTVAAMPFYTASKATFEVSGKEFPRVTWWKEPGMRSMYICLGFVVLTSATNGYDGSLLTIRGRTMSC